MRLQIVKVLFICWFKSCGKWALPTIYIRHLNVSPHETVWWEPKPLRKTSRQVEPGIPGIYFCDASKKAYRGNFLFCL